MKKYRFFYHYNKQNKGLTLHFKKACIPVQNIVCEVPCESKWNKTQPNLVMQGFASQVLIQDGVALVQ